jgi:hypothetical protein
LFAAKVFVLKIWGRGISKADIGKFLKVAPELLTILPSMRAKISRPTSRESYKIGSDLKNALTESFFTLKQRTSKKNGWAVELEKRAISGLMSEQL